MTDTPTAIVTGGGKGIGRACCQVLAGAGFRVIVLDKDEAVTGVAAAMAGDCRGLVCDVSSHEEVSRAFERFRNEFGRLDLLVNNAGYHIAKSVEQTSEQEWDFLLATNLKSVFLCSKFAIPLLRETRGSIVNMASMVGLVGQPNAGAYTASKGGIIAMTKGMALDLAADGIRVNCVCPGWVATPLVDDWFSQQKDPEQTRRHIYGLHPMGRIAGAEEVARAVLFLASQQASFITGIALPVDGAVTLGY
ncbi:MAG: SDR family oxidoreductase [Bryobacterales bacterium]|nr:SDR family oxidoreductase [Bryobacterales bacterium]